MHEDGARSVAETLPGNSEQTFPGMDVSADNPFELLFGGNEADGETLLDSSHPQKLEYRETLLRSPDSVIQEVAETLPCSSEPKVLEMTENCEMLGSPDSNQEGVENCDAAHT
ncbi:hypothetical protein JTB14_017821 [Gonioctena quinquepunctata]|nr:hypothetical protein JTB14_017821 [Gonioctena quinquepunctata]